MGRGDEDSRIPTFALVTCSVAHKVVSGDNVEYRGVAYLSTRVLNIISGFQFNILQLVLNSIQTSGCIILSTLVLK
jgi:hypothetical protein